MVNSILVISKNSIIPIFKIEVENLEFPGSRIENMLFIEMEKLIGGPIGIMLFI